MALFFTFVNELRFWMSESKEDRQKKLQFVRKSKPESGCNEPLPVYSSIEPQQKSKFSQTKKIFPFRASKKQVITKLEPLRSKFVKCSQWF